MGALCTFWQVILLDLVPITFDQHGMAGRTPGGVAFLMVDVTGVHMVQALLHGDVSRPDKC